MEVKIIKETKIEGSVNFDGECRFEPDGDVGIITVAESVNVARLTIKAGWSIKAGGSIKAGWSIEAGEYILSILFDIRCTSIITRTLPFWRCFYAAMPPLVKWASLIMDEGKCWSDLRRAINREQAEQVCGWNGWHWIIAAQLKMFFGLAKEVAPPSGWLPAEPQQ